MDANDLPHLREELGEEKFNELLAQHSRLREALEKSDKLPYEFFHMPPAFLEDIYRGAYMQYQAGQLKEARECFEYITWMNYKEPRYVLALAAAYQREKNYVKAIETYEFLASLVPETPLPYFYIYECCMQLQLPDLARRALELVIERALMTNKYPIMQAQAEAMLEGHNAQFPVEEAKDKEEVPVSAATKEKGPKE